MCMRAHLTHVAVAVLDHLSNFLETPSISGSIAVGFTTELPHICIQPVALVCAGRVLIRHSDCTVTESSWFMIGSWWWAFVFNTFNRGDHMSRKPIQHLWC